MVNKYTLREDEAVKHMAEADGFDLTNKCLRREAVKSLKGSNRKQLRAACHGFVPVAARSLLPA